MAEAGNQTARSEDRAAGERRSLLFRQGVNDAGTNMPVKAEGKRVSPSLAFLAIALCTAASACKSAPVAKPGPLLLEPGLGACTTTIRSDGRIGTIQATHKSGVIREVVDVDGDKKPEEVRVATLDREGRVVLIERLGADGTSTLSREARVWDGPRLQRREIDRLKADGSEGTDGTPDEVITLTWSGEQLLTESVDQLDAEGLLGVDGTPEFVTTWEYEAGVRTRGTQVDKRDGAVLRVDQLTWDGPQLVSQAIDLGGDGEVDIWIANTWRDGRIVGLRLEGKLENAEVTYEYCR